MVINPCCPTCGNTSKLVSFLTFEYHYCETCKDEVLPGGKKVAKAAADPWVRKGEIGYCEACGSDIIEALDDIMDLPTTVTMINLPSKFRRIQPQSTNWGVYECTPCSINWSPWTMSQSGCSKYSYSLDRVLILIKGRGWI